MARGALAAPRSEEYTGAPTPQAAAITAEAACSTITTT